MTKTPVYVPDVLDVQKDLARVIRFRDALGATDSYLNAMEMMTEAAFNGSGKEYCAFLLIIEAAKKEINDAQLLVDQMEGDT